MAKQKPDFDLSPDDFADDKAIQKSREEIRLYDQMVKESIETISNELGVKKGSHKNLKGFAMFKSLKATVCKSLTDESGTHISLVSYFSSYPVPKSHNSGIDEYLVGHITTAKTYPKTYICKETIREKISELIFKKELDFQHSNRFSRKFYVLTENRDNLSLLLQSANLNVLTEFPDMEVELRGQDCLFRHSQRAVSQKEAIQLCKLAKILKSIL